MSDQHTTVQYQLRLPQELRDKIKKSSGEHNRSMNADIVARLEQSFEASAVLTDIKKADYEELKQNLTQDLKKDMRLITEELSTLIDKFNEYKSGKNP
ncbi:Arc family DNA-binding protein [Psychrobacter sp. ASPA161_6]|uniref:Arc family DNA-binding protein n=1 Tax=Psychrobacter sp. ASPA161_6 TaxID=3160962 RepID=UPI003F8238E2